MLVALDNDYGQHHAVNPANVYEVQPVLQPSGIPNHPDAQSIILFGVPGIPDPCMLYMALDVDAVVALLNGG